MAVRAKFRVNAVLDSRDSNDQVTCRIVKLHPVTGSGSEENRAFWEATPVGALEMTITNKQAFEQFVCGRPVYVDFTFPDE